MPRIGPRWTFDELRAPEDADWCTSLAYWLGPYAGKLDAEELLALGSVMGAQYDFEEQADAYGAALPDDQAWTKLFAPVAPVQLTDGWSPLPCAASVFGEPVALAGEAGTGSRMAAMGWGRDQVSAVKTTARRIGSADEKRWLGLLAVTVSRAQEDRRGLLVVAKPGWSYEHVARITKTTAKLMKEAGFVVTTRRP